MNSTRSVAIDGPSGAGKSTIARAVSKMLGFIYVDTGALYRAIGLYALTCGADTKNPAQVVPLLKRIDVSLRFVKDEQRVILNGEDVSQRIRENAVSMAASNVSAIPEVRAFLFDLQRSIAAANNVIMDGRDIGTVVLPNADVKIFLTATPEDRAMRRCDELAAKGQTIDYETILKEIKERDYNDSHRDIAPLKKAGDAVVVDTTGYLLEDSIAEISALIKSRLGIH
ncbi:(d)CMP kinase [Acetanaerobacterium elongatum]|uniref:Cytidylate kinase n=1 Tax=Acetanaerobacterium elongatum TaxID=258515 RepID=A0A1H0AGF7_9FIRM|nr:(d)CMP kinase [Acetanaerobacterium elongatum]SDN32123.1 cytidylate kinase [Acetanaerobacterium elongatum]